MEYVGLEGGRWQMGNVICSGGFAQVHEAVSPGGEHAVFKLVPKDPGAKRELLMEDLAGMPNVIPILDTGEHGDCWVLAMPRAEMSLRDHLQHHGRLEPDDAKPILVYIANALIAPDGGVVHRDLKPGNVLRRRPNDLASCLQPQDLRGLSHEGDDPLPPGYRGAFKRARLD